MSDSEMMWSEDWIVMPFDIWQQYNLLDYRHKQNLWEHFISAKLLIWFIVIFAVLLEINCFYRITWCNWYLVLEANLTLCIEETMATLDTFVPSVFTQDSRKRLQIHNDLINHLRDPDGSMYCEEMDKFMDGVTSWVGCSNYKVSIFNCVL